MSRGFIASTAALIGAAVFALGAAAEDAPSLQFPVLCELGDTCFIQQTMDRDAGPGARDFTCGPMSYDGHSGTDIRLPDRAAMEEGWTVVAAAPGRVRGTRDGVPDFGLAAMPEGQDCGNGVAITHDGGWETQYCHLRQGSVRVAEGDIVEAGAPLGEIGFSGRTEFPHLHITLRRDGEEVDPFDPSDAATCGAGANALWAEAVPLQPGGFLAAGFSDGIPDFDAIKAGVADAPMLMNSAPALVFWANLFSGRAGDEVQLRIVGPDGSVFHEHTVALERTQAELFRASGRRTPNQGWPRGVYTGEATLSRDGEVVDRIAAEVTLN